MDNSDVDMWTQQDVKPDLIECDSLDINPINMNSAPETLVNNLYSPNIKLELECEPVRTGLCCCCLELVCLKGLWGAHEWMGRSEVYGLMLQDCFNITFPKQDTEQICEICITHLRNAVKFRRQVIRCQNKLYGTLDTGASSPEYHIFPEDSENNTRSSKIGKRRISKFEVPMMTEFDYDNGDDLFDKDEPIVKTEKKKVKTLKILSQKPKKTIKIFSYKRNAETGLKPEDEPIVKIESKKAKKTIKILSLKRNAETGVTPVPHRKRSKPKKDIRQIKAEVALSRLNPGLILEHSTVCPFKSRRGLFNCFYCNLPYASFDELTSHMKENHDKISFNSIIKCIAKRTDKVKANVSDIKCKICWNAVNNIEGLITHLTEEHSIKFDYSNDSKPQDIIVQYELSNGKFICGVCKKEFAYFKTLAVHMNEHSSDHVCEICGRRFLELQRLRAHRPVHDSRAVKCDICNKTYRSKTILIHHLTYTHKEKPYICTLCGETFRSYKLKTLHLVDFHGRTKADLTCHLCSKEFTLLGSLRGHMKYIHSDVTREPKYKCNECGKMFTSQEALKGHKTVHTGEKNYECEFCSKRFSRSKTLREHVKIHTNDKRWSCAACAQAFVQKCSLRGHIKVHHSDKDMEALIVYKKPLNGMNTTALQ